MRAMHSVQGGDEDSNSDATQRFQITDSPHRAVLTPPNLKGALCFVCLML